MANYTDGMSQQAIDRFRGGKSFGAADRKRYDSFVEQTKGLDRDAAMQAYQGGNFGANDRKRYDEIMSKRPSAQEFKDEKQKQVTTGQEKIPNQSGGEMRAAVEPGEGRSYTGDPKKDFGNTQPVPTGQQNIPEKDQQMTTGQENIPVSLGGTKPDGPSDGPRAEAKDRANQYSMQYGASKDFFGHKDYHAARAGGASNEDILKQLDSNPNQLRGGNVKGGGGLYDQIKAGNVPGPKGQGQGSNNNNNNTTNSNNTNIEDSFNTDIRDSFNTELDQKNDTNINNTQEQNVSQSNPQTSTVTGNNNYVNQMQDNSIRNYGGDNRSFVYNSQSAGGGKYTETPASMATLAGFYAPDDSHGAQAARLDRNQTLNRDAQKKYKNTSHIAEGAIARAGRNSYIDPKALDKRIHERSMYHDARSKVQGGNIFGDLFGMNGPTWNSAKPAAEIEKPDFEKMYDTYTDF